MKFSWWFIEANRKTWTQLNYLNYYYACFINLVQENTKSRRRRIRNYFAIIIICTSSQSLQISIQCAAVPWSNMHTVWWTEMWEIASANLNIFFYGFREWMISIVWFAVCVSYVLNANKAVFLAHSPSSIFLITTKCYL